MPSGVYERRRGMKVGRKRLLTRALVRRIEVLLPQVFNLEIVGAFLGVHRTTWRGWLRRGRKEAARLASDDTATPRKSEKIFVSFFYAYRRGMAVSSMICLTAIQAAARTDWRAAAWLLERRFPEWWSKHAREIRQLEQRVAALCDNSR